MIWTRRLGRPRDSGVGPKLELRVARRDAGAGSSAGRQGLRGEMDLEGSKTLLQCLGKRRGQGWQAVQSSRCGDHFDEPLQCVSLGYNAAALWMHIPYFWCSLQVNQRRYALFVGTTIVLSVQSHYFFSFTQACTKLSSAFWASATGAGGNAFVVWFANKPFSSQ